jgi:hypothetical protein
VKASLFLDFPVRSLTTDLQTPALFAKRCPYTITIKVKPHGIGNFAEQAQAVSSELSGEGFLLYGGFACVEA